LTRPSITGLGRILNISSTGAFLETTMPLRHLSLLYLQPLEPPLGLTPMAHAGGHIAATVVRRSVDGYGLAWCEFGAAGTAAYAILASPDGGRAGERQLALELSRAPGTPPMRGRASSLDGHIA
jgi:hypothetical protein